MFIDHDKNERISYDTDQRLAERYGVYGGMQDCIKGIQDCRAQLAGRPSNLWKLHTHGIDALLSPDLAQQLPEEAKIARRIKLLERERDTMMARAAAMEPTIRDAVQLRDNCAAYVAAHPTGEDATFTAPELPPGPVDIPTVRTQIVEAQTERRRVAESTYLREEAREDLRTRLARADTEGTERARRLIAFGDVGDLFAIRVTGRVDLLPWLSVLLGPDAIEAALRPYVDTLPASIPADERAAILAELDARILALEEAEEAEICRREALGDRVQRRGNANPAVVLGMRAAA